MIERPPPKLRSDLVVRRRVFSGEVKYVVKDPIKLEYCTVDELSWQILSMCDGKRDLGELSEVAERLAPGAGFDPITLHTFIDNYRQFNFFEDAWERNIMLIERRRTDRSRVLKKAVANPLEIHLPAWDPNDFMDRVIDSIRFLWSRWAMLAYTLIILAATWITFTHADELTLSFGELWTIQGKTVIGLVVLWFILLFSVVLHEFGHGLTCKFYGGAVHKMGFLFLYFNPCMFCDVTESYFFENKNHKHAVTLAGGVVDLLTAAAGVFIWFFTSPDLFINQVAHRLAIFNGFSGILVNFNPLMKYDGYYLLSDHLEVPNLRGDSFRFLGIQMRKLLGLPHEPDYYSPRERKIFWSYGLLAVLYSFLVLSFIALMVNGWLVGKYRATGYLLTGALILLMTKNYWMGLGGFSRFFYLDKKAHFRKWRPAYVGGLLLLILAFLFVPLPRHVKGSFELRPGQEVVIRSQEAGLLDSVLIEEGQVVEAGTPLFILSDERTARDQRQAAVSRLRAEMLRKSAAFDDDPGRAQMHSARARVSAAAEDHFAARLARLAPTSPIRATVLTPRLIERQGLYFDAGDTLCELGDLSLLRAEVLLDESDLGMLDESLPVEMRPHSDPGRVLEGRIERVAFTSSGGRYRQIYRVQVWVENDEGLLRPGMSGTARFDAGSVSAFQHLMGRMSRLFRIDFWV